MQRKAKDRRKSEMSWGIWWPALDQDGAHVWVRSLAWVEPVWAGSRV